MYPIRWTRRNQMLAGLAVLVVVAALFLVSEPTNRSGGLFGTAGGQEVWDWSVQIASVRVDQWNEAIIFSDEPWLKGSFTDTVSGDSRTVSEKWSEKRVGAPTTRWPKAVVSGVRGTGDLKFDLELWERDSLLSGKDDLIGKASGTWKRTDLVNGSGSKEVRFYDGRDKKKGDYIIIFDFWGKRP